jgi:hypothetical protein
MSLGCLLLVTAGCGASALTPPPSAYLPPLRVSPRVLEADRGSARAAKHALRVIARTMRAPFFAGKDPIAFADVQYQLIIVNAGSPNAFTAEQTVARELKVMPDSSATIRERILTSPRFVSELDRLHWQAAGRRPYVSSTDRAGATFQSDLPAGAFSFTPHGLPVTFGGARDLPTSARSVSHELRRLLRPNGSTPPAALTLRLYGFLLATAPLTHGARKAVLEAVTSLPGIHMCASLPPARDRLGKAFCINDHPISTEIIINPYTGVAVVVCERLDDLTPIYRNFAVGSLVDSDTFSLQTPAS